MMDQGANPCGPNLRLALWGRAGRLIRDLGYRAKAHTVMDRQCCKPPFCLFAVGLGEVQPHFGEVILTPTLAHGLKSGERLTTPADVHDKPIDFRLQKFLRKDGRNGRECRGAITAGRS